MYIIMNSYLQILWNDCHNKSSTHIVNDLCVMRTFKICLLNNVQACNPGLLTMVTSLYIVFLGLNCFFNWTLVSFEAFYPFCSLPNPTPSNHICVLCICEYAVFVLFVCVDFTLKWDSIVPPFSVIYSIKHMSSRFTNIALNNTWIMLHCICIFYIHSSIHRYLSSTLHPCLGYHKWHCN